jgi:hypothetical protein
VSRFAYVELHPAATMLIGAAFLCSVVEAFPYRIHTMLTDNGVSFTDQPRYRSGSPHASEDMPSTGSAGSMASHIGSPSPITPGRMVRRSG